MKEHFPEQESCLVQHLGLKEARTFFENEVTWTAHCGTSSIEHQQWCVGRRHRYAAKGCSWVMIHSTSFAVPGPSHRFDHSCCHLRYAFNSLLVVYHTGSWPQDALDLPYQVTRLELHQIHIKHDADIRNRLRLVEVGNALFDLRHLAFRAWDCLWWTQNVLVCACRQRQAWHQTEASVTTEDAQPFCNRIIAPLHVDPERHLGQPTPFSAKVDQIISLETGLKLEQSLVWTFSGRERVFKAAQRHVRDQ